VGAYKINCVWYSAKHHYAAGGKKKRKNTLGFRGERYRPKDVRNGGEGESLQKKGHTRRGTDVSLGRLKKA